MKRDQKDLFFQCREEENVVWFQCSVIRIWKKSNCLYIKLKGHEVTIRNEGRPDYKGIWKKTSHSSQKHWPLEWPGGFIIQAKNNHEFKDSEYLNNMKSADST